MYRFLFLIGFLLVSIAWASEDVAAQPRDETLAFTYVVNWPPGLRADGADEEALLDYDLLPFIDTLALGYAYFEHEGQPALHFSLAWTPGAFGIYDGLRVPYEDLPEDLRIVAVDLRADVYVADEPVAALMLSLDSLALASAPDRFFFEKEDVPWNTVFAGTTEDEARAYFNSGFALHDLHIVRIAFAAYDPPAGEEDGHDPVFDPRYPTGVGIYPPDIGIFVDWVLWPRRQGAGKRGTTAASPPRRPREGIGRTTPSDTDRPRTRTGDDPDEGPEEDAVSRTRTGERDKAAEGRDGKGKKRSGKLTRDDDEDDDDKDLLPAALVGVAAVGVLAYAAGTVGYYGNAEAPIGVTSGYVRPGGGVLLQVAVNAAVLGADGEPEKLVGKVMGFYRVAGMPVQPAVGLGVIAEENGDDIKLSPSLSLGLVGNFGPVVLLGGYDVAAAGVDFGIAFNFRSRRNR